MSAAPPFRLGLLRLTDAAPLIVAQEFGYFAAEGIAVELSLEPSWSNIADKLAYGLLDGAMMLPPLALALRLGLRGKGGPERIIVPAGLSLNGNTVTLSERWSAAIERDGPAPAGTPAALETARRFAALMRARGEKPCLAVVHTFSTHNLLLRYWLAAGGIDPESEVSFTVVPPAETVAAMRAGRIDGFCAGAPWGEAAAHAGLGGAVATSHAIWNNGAEKMLALREALAEREPHRVQAVLRALLRAAQHCDAPAHTSDIAALLSRPEYIGLPADIIATSLPGGAGSDNADRSVFFANAATYPWQSQALWFLREMRRWGYLDDIADPAGAVVAFRPELYAQAAGTLGLPVPNANMKSEGGHGGSWSLAASPAPIAMGPDLFVDGARFDARPVF